MPTDISMWKWEEIGERVIKATRDRNSINAFRSVGFKLTSAANESILQAVDTNVFPGMIAATFMAWGFFSWRMCCDEESLWVFIIMHNLFGALVEVAQFLNPT